jgi:hypothetical protein
VERNIEDKAGDETRPEPDTTRLALACSQAEEVRATKRGTTTEPNTSLNTQQNQVEITHTRTRASCAALSEPRRDTCQPGRASCAGEMDSLEPQMANRHVKTLLQPQFFETIATL